MTNYTVVKKSEILLVGIKCRTSNSPEAAPKDIPALWGRFYSENIMNQIPNKATEEVIALYCDYDGDHTQPYSVLIGCPVSSMDAVPEGMMVKMIPGGTYIAYQAIGEHPKALLETWGNIWQTDLPRTYTGDYEVYGQKFTSASPQEVEVFIAIEENSSNDY
jgi:predicted transcriptional regulator YdeE